VRRATACVLLLSLALAAGCGSDDKDEQAAARARAKAARHARLVAAGKPVFVKRCGFCHTIDGRTAHPTFVESPIPNLDEVKPKASYVAQRVEEGGFDMPISGRPTDRAFAPLVAYVAEVAGGKVLDTGDREPEAVALGESIFRERCERCHAIDGRRATGRPVFPGTDFNNVKPSQDLVMRQALRGIPGMMPSVRGKLSPAELHALAVYVTATAGE
jgi:mono/diheme cytochrome c family protein